jgi:uncharacterized protein (TIGR02147 family)
MFPQHFPQDHRAYVREELELRQKRRPAYSMRAFARDLEVSPSFLCEFLAGRQGLSRERTVWIAEKLKLTAEQAEHFQDLIEAKFALNADKKKLAKFRAQQRNRNSDSHLSLENFHLIADWYHFALLEILGVPGPQKSMKQIARLIDVPEADLKEASARLLRLGLLKKDGDRLTPVDDTTSAGGEIPDRAIRLSHQQTLAMHAAAVDRKEYTERENVSVTFSIAAQDWPKLRKEIQQSVMNVVARFAGVEAPKDQVVSLGLQAITLLDLETSPKAEV